MKLIDSPDTYGNDIDSSRMKEIEGATPFVKYTCGIFENVAGKWGNLTFAGHPIDPEIGIENLPDVAILIDCD